MDVIEDQLMAVAVATQRSRTLHIFFSMTGMSQRSWHQAGEETALPASPNVPVI